MFRPMNALDVLCAQLTRDLFAIAKFLLVTRTGQTDGRVQCIMKPPIILWDRIKCLKGRYSRRSRPLLQFATAFSFAYAVHLEHSCSCIRCVNLEAIGIFPLKWHVERLAISQQFWLRQNISKHSFSGRITSLNLQKISRYRQYCLCKIRDEL